MSCPECFKGHQHEGTPLGKEEKLHGLDVYVSAPPDGAAPKGLVIIVPDAFGWKFVNSRLLADHYAAKGNFLVYIPDVMNGNWAPFWLTEPMERVFETDTVKAWAFKPWHITQLVYGVAPFLIGNRFSKAWPRVSSFFESVRMNEGASLSVGAAGFCWGGKHVMTLAQADKVTKDGKPFVDAIFTGHPSGLAIPDDFEKIAKPASVAIGDKDFVLTKDGVDTMKKVWSESRKDVPTEVVVYEGAGHGFCVRVDPKNKNVFQQSLDAQEQATKWFTKHFEK